MLLSETKLLDYEEVMKKEKNTSEEIQPTKRSNPLPTGIENKPLVAANQYYTQLKTTSPHSERWRKR